MPLAISTSVGPLMVSLRPSHCINAVPANCTPMSRACAGLARGKVVIALPGSEGAVRLAMTQLVVPELRHLVQQASK